MTAYWVTTYREVRDPERLAAYAALAGPAITSQGGRFVVRGLPEAAHEAGVLERVVVIEFPDLATALAVHDGREYQEALAVLGDAVTRDLRIVPGAE